jgi:hypothetical protein
VKEETIQIRSIASSRQDMHNFQIRYFFACTVYCFFFFQLCRGEDAFVQGGISPDGRYEVRIFKTASEDDYPSNYYYAVVNAKSNKVIQKLAEGGGFADYDGAKNLSEVVWHESGDFFALTDHGTRHSMEMYVYQISPPKVTLLNTQDYFQNALGRVGAISVYATSVVKPQRWDKDDLICSLFFDARTKTGRSPQYTADFKLELAHGPNMVSRLSFVEMSPPVSQN